VHELVASMREKRFNTHRNDFPSIEAAEDLYSD
jgi:hypothetical protein